MTNEFAIVWAHKDRLILGLANTVGLVVLATALALVLGALMATALASQSGTEMYGTQKDAGTPGGLFIRPPALLSAPISSLTPVRLKSV